MTDEALIEKTWPEYSVAGPLGHGTYGTVYHVRRRDLPDMDAAVKVIAVPTDEDDIRVLQADGFSTGEADAFFARLAEEWKNEILLMKRYQGMSHFISIEDCKVLDRERAPGGKWILIRMEKLKSLPSYLSDKTLTEEEVIELGRQICDALRTCHADGLIHRDIKPENIFVQDRNPSGVLYKLGDFGTAKQLDKLSRSFSVKGAVAYMAPEILQTRQYDERADVYSLGLTLYRLMNGNRLPFLPARQLFSHEDYEAATRMRLNGAPLPPAADASPGFNQVLARACAYDPKDRYPSAQAFSDALSALSSPGQKARRRGFPLWAALLGAGLLALLLGILRPWETDALTRSDTAQKATPVPMISAQFVPDQMRQALEEAMRSWQAISGSPPEDQSVMADCPAFASIFALAPALDRDRETGAYLLDHKAGSPRLSAADEDGKAFGCPYDAALKGYVPQDLTGPGPKAIRALTAQYSYTVRSARWEILYTYQQEEAFQATECEIRLLQAGTDTPAFSWYAQKVGDSLQCLLTLQRAGQPPLRKKYTITEWRTEP